MKNKEARVIRVKNQFCLVNLDNMGVALPEGIVLEEPQVKLEQDYQKFLKERENENE